MMLGVVTVVEEQEVVKSPVLVGSVGRVAVVSVHPTKAQPRALPGQVSRKVGLWRASRQGRGRDRHLARLAGVRRGLRFSGELALQTGLVVIAPQRLGN